MILRSWLLFAGLALSLALTGCGPRASATDPGSSTGTQPGMPIGGTLTVFAASSLTDAFGEIGAAFTAAHPGVTVRFNFGGSAVLRQQLEQGAPAGVFAAADDQHMRFARASGIVGENAPVFAKNRLVLIVPRPNPAGITGLEDLGKTGVKLVLAGRSVPAGAYARGVLERLGPEASSRALGNVRSEESSVRSVVTKVQLGEADGGIVYASDVTPAVAGSVQVLPIPDALNVTAAYPIAVLRQARNPEAAAAFISFVRSPAAQEILGRHGFIVDADTGEHTTATAP